MAKTEDPVLIVSVHVDRLDAAVAIEFKSTTQKEALDGPKIVVFDWSAVDFIDSSKLGAIVASMKHLRQDQTLTLAGLRPAVDKLFCLTRINNVSNLFSTLARALDELCDRPD